MQVFLWYSGWKVTETGQWDKATHDSLVELQQAYNVKPADGTANVPTRFVLNHLLKGEDPYDRPPVAPPGPPGGIAGRLKNAVAGTSLDVHNWTRNENKVPIKPESSIESAPPPPPEPPRHPVSAVIKIGVAWLDEADQPLYRQPRSSGYTMNEEVLDNMLSHIMVQVLQRVAPRTASLGGPDRGRFAGQLYTELLAGTTRTELNNFMTFVTRYPGKYVGKPLKFPNAYLAWIKGGAVTE